jgi:hypothetical protein
VLRIPALLEANAQMQLQWHLSAEKPLLLVLVLQDLE